MSNCGTVGARSAAGGGTVIAVQAKVLWRPTWERVDPLVTRAVVRFEGRPPRTVGRTGARSLARYIDGLGVVAPGTYSCPDSNGGHDSVRFGDPAVRVWIDEGDCRFASVWDDGRRAPALAAPQLYERIRGDSFAAR